MEDTPVCAVWHHNRLEQIPSHQVLTTLQAACATIKSAKLGFEAHKIGTYTLWSGAVMEMYLTGVPVYTISCSLADSRATLSTVTVKNSPNTSQSRCSHFNLSEPSQTLHLAWSPMKTSHSTTITTMLRQDTILGDKSWCVHRHSLFSPDQSTMQTQFMEEASSYWSLKALGEGRVEITFNSKPNPSARLAHLLVIHVLGRRLASKLLSTTLQHGKKVKQS